MHWETPEKPAELAESRLIDAILEGYFPIGSTLPAERELAGQLGVTRPTLREVLQRLARDGWIEIRHGRSTRVRDFWQEGNLGVLSAMARYPAKAPADFVPNLLAVRQLLAPAYARLAAERAPAQVIDLLVSPEYRAQDPQTLAEADWKLHHRLTVLSGNPIFTLILNGFSDLYLALALTYFQASASRLHSLAFYQELRAAVESQDLDRVERLTRRTMAESLQLWQEVAGQQAR